MFFCFSNLFQTNELLREPWIGPAHQNMFWIIFQKTSYIHVIYNNYLYIILRVNYNFRID